MSVLKATSANTVNRRASALTTARVIKILVLASVFNLLNAVSILANNVKPARRATSVPTAKENPSLTQK